MSKLNIHVLAPIITALDEKIEEYNHFVETGTLFGETIINLQPHFKQLSTVELSLEHYLHFNNTKQSYGFTNVYNYLGDSMVLLPGMLLIANNGNIIFWLDGHYSSGDTASGIKECPLLEECTYIDNLCKSKKCIILIDDISLFERKDFYDWSDISFEKICNTFKNFKIKKSETFRELGTPPYWQGDILAMALEK